jgi:Helix-turn-helix.
MDNDFSHLIRLLRGDESLRDAAQRAGISHTYLGQLEVGIDKRTGKVINPSADTLQRLAKAYNYPYEKLLASVGYLNDYDLTPTLKEEHLAFYRKVGQLSDKSIAMLEQQADRLLELETQVIEDIKAERKKKINQK